MQRDRSPVRKPQTLSPETLKHNPATLKELVTVVSSKLNLLFDRLAASPLAPLVDEVLANTSCKTRAGLERDIASEIWTRMDSELLHMDDAQFTVVAFCSGKWPGSENTNWLAFEAFPELVDSRSTRIASAMRIGSESNIARDKVEYVGVAPWLAVRPISDSSLPALRARWDASVAEFEIACRRGFQKVKMQSRQRAIHKAIASLGYEASDPQLFSIARSLFYKDYLPPSLGELLGAILAIHDEDPTNCRVLLGWGSQAQRYVSDCPDAEAKIAEGFQKMGNRKLTDAFFVALREMPSKELEYSFMHLRPGPYTGKNKPVC